MGIGVRRKKMDVILLGTLGSDVDKMETVAVENGDNVIGKKVWEGPTPEGSFVNIGGPKNMSTPEFFFLRMANELPFVDAVRVGMELCGKYATNLTRMGLEDGKYDFLIEQRTTKEKIGAYLLQAYYTEEGRKAIEVLDMVVDGSASPMSTYLYLIACIPREHGGAGLPKADVSVAYKTDNGLAPSSIGKYMAYDLYWPDRRVAVQYIGEKGGISGRDFDALSTNNSNVVLVSGETLRNKEYVQDVIGDFAARCVNGRTVTDIDLIWSMDAPRYDNMEMTYSDMVAHQ